MSRSNFLECNRCEHRISYKPEWIGAACQVRDCGGAMFVLTSDTIGNPPAVGKLETFKRKYGRKGASLIVRQGSHATSNVGLANDLLQLANELDELCKD